MGPTPKWNKMGTPEKMITVHTFSASRETRCLGRVGAGRRVPPDPAGLLPELLASGSGDKHTRAQRRLLRPAPRSVGVLRGGVVVFLPSLPTFSTPWNKQKHLSPVSGTNAGLGRPCPGPQMLTFPRQGRLAATAPQSRGSQTLRSNVSLLKAAQHNCPAKPFGESRLLINC